MDKRVAVIGLDGMPWHIMNTLFAQGSMPNLRSLTERSSTGILKSTIPPMTPPAWTSIASGVNPGKHGIFSFLKFDKRYKTKPVTSRDVRYPRIHEMIALMGMKSVCINMPLTYPILKIKGATIISDWTSPKISYYPESIKKYAKNYHPYTPISKFKNKNDFLSSEYDEGSSRVDTTNSMLEELDWDLFFVVYCEPDHLFHKCYEEVLDADERVLKIFNKIDETVKTADKIADYIIIVSDHGFSKYKFGLNINSYLDKFGLVEKTKTKIIKEFTDFRPKNKDIRSVTFSPKTYKLLKLKPLKPLKYLAKKIFKLLSGKEIRVSLLYVDPQKSKAFTPFPMAFGVIVKNEGEIDFVVNKLKKNEGVDQVWRREQMYKGPYTEKAPEIIFTPRFDEGWILGTTQVSPVTASYGKFYGHHPDGIIVIHSKEKNAQKEIGRTSTNDIVPTVLAYMNLPIPSDTDGRIIQDLTTKTKEKKPYNYLHQWSLHKKIDLIKARLEPKKIKIN